MIETLKNTRKGKSTSRQVQNENNITASNKSYFQQRMELLGITDDINKIALHKTELQTGNDIMEDVQIFREVDQGIEILVYTLDRLTIRIEKSGGKQKKDFSMTRLKDPIIKDNDIIKYLIPKGAGTHPFFPPGVVDKYEMGEQIHTLFLVEGYFKAFKAAMHGADIIGLSSITHMKETGKNNLHTEILKLMTTCNVQRMVWLTDGDALDISQKELTDGLDLYKRPNGFFQSVNTFKTLLSDYDNIEKWFFHIDTDRLFNDNNKLDRANLKGIDDLLISFQDKTADIIQDLQSVGNNSYYFQKFNVSYGLGKVHSHFHLADVKEFYLYHVERRPELKNKEFIFNGTRYIYNEETGNCDIKMPKDAASYFRSGDLYFEFIHKPNQHHEIETIIEQRQKSTIVDDHGKTFLKYIKKYKSFCNVPDHVSYQQVINNCFNLYSPLEIGPLDEPCGPEDCPTIISFLTHLFGENKIGYEDTETNQTKEYITIDLALDYLQLLYQKPQQKLPILCLVSKENNTGKSTFADFLRNFLGANVAIVGNSDLAGDFNAHWASKNVVICDETKIDKQHVVEKIKSLSTSKKIFMNAKGRGQVELDCFIKFVLITNNEETFIYASEEDIRYWVIKVPVLKKENPLIIDQLKQEIPMFLSMLNKRKLATEHKNRMWFHPQLLKTDALVKLVEKTKPSAEKQIRHYIREMFFNTEYDEILMSTTDIIKEVFNGSSKYDADYINGILKSNMKIDKYHVWKVEGCKDNYDKQSEAILYAESKGLNATSAVVKNYISKRYTYPKNEEVFEEKKGKVLKIVSITVDKPGRPFLFKQNMFLSPEEIQEIKSTLNDYEDPELPFH